MNPPKKSNTPKSKRRVTVSQKRPPEINLHQTMPNRTPQKSKRPIKRRHIFAAIVIFFLTIAILITAILLYSRWQEASKTKHIEVERQNTETKQAPPTTGKILLSEPIVNYDATQTLELIRQSNKAFDTPVTTGIQKQTIRYTSSDGTSDDVPIYARVYWPANKSTKNLPVLAFAPGTTGIGDACAASLEEPAKRNWANYDSKLAAYASQGYVVIITDYEGMRDPSRIHHYMVGELEGRAVLDSVRALNNLDATKNNINSKAIFVGGYSQGGHAAYWANQLAPTYTPEIKLAGAIGFGPVTDVSQTLTDAITANANINWFGPFVIVSYQDWYKHEYPVDKILLPQWTKNLRSDVLRECIDNVDRFWPSNNTGNKSEQVYTPQFIAAAKSGSISNDPIYRQFAADMLKNITGAVTRTTPVLLNQGAYDNVILPRQSQAAFTRFCKNKNAVTYRVYDKSLYAVQTYNPSGLVDHYQTMNAAFAETMAWMNALAAGSPVANNCK